MISDIKIFLALSVAAFWTAAADTVLVDSQTPVDAGPKGATLVFSDEFNGTELNREKWCLGINEQNALYDQHDCAYSMDNISFTNGTMIFIARYEPDGIEGQLGDQKAVFRYSSGAVNTDGKFRLQQNMYVELRVKLPVNDGGFCAFWSMPNPENGSRFDSPTEMVQINFFEYIASENRRRFSSSLWFNDYLENEIPANLPSADHVKVGRNHCIITNNQRKGHWGGDTSRVPVFELFEWYEWNHFVRAGFMTQPARLEWFIAENSPPWESAPYLTYTGETVYSADHFHWEKGRNAQFDVWRRNVPAVLDNSLILNFELRDADWAGGPVQTNQLPAQMVIDYIRVYQLPERK